MSDYTSLCAAHCGRCQEIVLFPGPAMPTTHKCGTDALGPVVEIARVEKGAILEGSETLEFSEGPSGAEMHPGAVKCPECVKTGQRSRVEYGPSSETLLDTHSFNDEDGRYHLHDPNITTTEMTCSNGHKWTETSRHKCWCEREDAGA